MKTIILIKQHPVIQLGHLYEHLFLRRVNALFYEQKLYKSLDYAVHGTTYEQGGIIIVECILYSQAAIKLSKEVELLKIGFEKENQNISTALYQITAEESYMLYIDSREELLRQLMQLDSQPWEHIDSIGVLDTKSIRRRNKPIYLTEESQVKPRTLQLSIRLDTDFSDTHRELLPLFRFVGRMILLTLGNQVTAAHGVYAGELYSKTQSHVVSELLVAKEALQLVTTEKVSKTTRETLSYMLNNDTYARISKDLQSITYESALDTAPSLDRLLIETGILIGAKGWQNIATAQNIKELLSHSVLEIKLGRQTAIQPILRQG